MADIIQMPADDYDFTAVNDAQLVRDAEALGCEVIYPADNELFIDIDSNTDMKRFLEGIKFFEDNNFKVTYEVKESKSGLPNRHIIVKLPFSIDDAKRVAFQAALGSDQRRELIATMRLITGAEVITCFFEKKEKP